MTPKSSGETPGDALIDETGAAGSSDAIEAVGPSFVEPPDAAAVDDADAMVASPVPVDDGEAAVSLGDFFRRLYQLTYSKILGVVIILALAVLVLIGVLIDQAPAWSDAAARADFLTQAQGKYGRLFALLKAVGAFHIFSTIGFYVVVAALAISITGCTVHRLPQLWQRWRHPRTVVSERFFTAARYRASVPISGSAGALEKATTELQARHYRVIKAGPDSLYADTFGWGPFGTALSHLSFLVIMAAFLVTGLWGTAVTLNVPVGDTGVPVEGTSLLLKVTSYNQTVDDATGAPTDYVSHAILEDGGTVVAEHDIRVNSPLVYGKWHFHQYSPGGFAVDVTATKADGTTMFSGTVPLDFSSTDGTAAVGEFHIDAIGVTVDVWTPASGQTSTQISGLPFVISPGEVVFVVFPDGSTTPSGMDSIAPVARGGSIAYGDLTLTFDRESSYTGIMVRTDPGTWLMWLGGILLVVGMTMTFACRHRRLWIRAADDRLLFASADKEDPGFRQYFLELTDQAPSWFAERSN